MGFIKGLLQFIFFVVFVGAGVAAATIISNNLPLNDPPGMLTRISTYLNTNVAETTLDTEFPELRLRRYEAPPALLIETVRRAVEALKWEIVEQDTENHTIKAVVTTKMIQFKDDVLIRADKAQPSGSNLYIRSSSRVGKGDLGTNTRHVMDLKEAVYTFAPLSTRIRDEDQAWGKPAEAMPAETSEETPSEPSAEIEESAPAETEGESGAEAVETEAEEPASEDGGETEGNT